MSDISPVDAELAEVWEVLEADVALAQKHSDADPDTALVEWYLGKWDDLSAAEKRIKAHAKVLLNQVANRRKGLQWKFGPLVMAKVNRDLNEQKGKKKSVTYGTGRAGYRTVGGKDRVVIDNEQQAIAAAELHCPDAVTTKLKVSELAAWAESTGEPLEGTHIEQMEARESFYPQVDLPKIEGESDGRQPEAME